jgi:hypothetical protein
VVEGAERMLTPPSLLANLGKASANAYNMYTTVRLFHFHKLFLLSCLIDLID